jgi:hypothetical protein
VSCVPPPTLEEQRRKGGDQRTVHDADGDQAQHKAGVGHAAPPTTSATLRNAGSSVPVPTGLGYPYGDVASNPPPGMPRITSGSSMVLLPSVMERAGPAERSTGSQSGASTSSGVPFSVGGAGQTSGGS